MKALAPAVHRAIVCVDVEEFTDRRRTHPHQIAVRKGLYRALDQAFARAGVALRHCYHEDRGDGALILVPPDVPKDLLVAGVPQELVTALAQHNHEHDERARIRLRLALHAGEIHHDDHGVTGTAINLAFRLLEAAPLKLALADSSGTLAMVASQWFFDEVIRHTPGSASSSYRQVPIVVKETRTSAWICRPDDPYPPDETSMAEPPAPPQAREWPVPRQLPAATPVFVGREADLAALDALPGRDGACEAVVISAIAGGAGVGKTTLAVHWAQRVRERFPDGQLFVNLRGYDPGDPLSPLEALDGFLRALDVPTTKIPLDLQSRAALFRSMLAGRRILVVLDNAGSADQVRPLLPGVPGCLALITSRSRLSGLTTREGAHRLPLDVLPVDQAVHLLRRTIGAPRVDAEPDEAQELAQRCAYLPLALRIAADRAAGHPHLKLADLIEELADESARLDMLATDDETTAIRAVFSWSYRRLPDDAARAFRLLGLHAGPDIALNAAAALLGLSVSRTRTVLDTLTGQHLLEHSGRDRYRFHDLLRVYAAERADHDDTHTTRDTAVGRLLTWYLHTAGAAHDVLLPHGHRIDLDQSNTEGPSPLEFAHRDLALAWFDAERHNLVAAVRHAAESGRHAITWKLAHTLIAFLHMWWYPDDWLTVLHTGGVAAQRLDDAGAQAVMLLHDGVWHREFGRYREAIELYERSLRFNRESDDRRIEGFCHNSLGVARTELGELDVAVNHLQLALQVFRDISDRRGEGIALSNIGEAYQRQGRLDDAIDCNRRAAVILRSTGNHEGRASALRRIGKVYRELQRYDDAAHHYREALDILRDRGHRRQTGYALVGLGEVHLDAGHLEAARQCLQEALAIFTDVDTSQAAKVRTKLAAIDIPRKVR
ncbi:tetratricopeptide repeat protein [Actinomadura sp. KC06]|uniref:ATP-binding protein n=1 Tax=Actinomadura sp. KC06 TaxID=2530369 RepID=UPI001053F62F|nr:tetratricopeptide repeat protein [Actinomadura sp. KC06]TDD38161.1 tetratricopeptide repeat protein [Actinomadura sp. KC06]